MDFTTFSSEDMLQEYLVSQSKLSTLVQKPKMKILSTKKEFKAKIESKELNLIKKSIEKSNIESGSEYFPSTESGKIKYTNSIRYNILH